MTIREEVRQKFGVELEQVAANYAEKAWAEVQLRLEGSLPPALVCGLEPGFKSVSQAAYLAGFKHLAEVIGRKFE